jgi:hypothetical protein
MSEALLALLSATGPAAVSVGLVIVGLLSQRLGAVTKMPAYYRWFYVAAVLVGASSVTRILGASTGLDEGLALFCTATFALGVTIGVVVAWRYWSWLFGERGR